jgi:ribosomal-protein-alanine N-acetyltransferase
MGMKIQGRDQPVPIITELALETKRCILRQPRVSDAPRLLSAFTSKEFPEYVTLGRIVSLEQVKDRIEDSRERWISGAGYTFTAIRKSDQLVIGQVALTKIEGGEIWSLAFWTHPDCWGEGFATEIARAAIHLAFDQLSAVRIWAAAAIWNTASLKVLRKLRMNYLGDNQDGYRLGEDAIPTSEYSLELSDWKQFK